MKNTQMGNSASPPGFRRCHASAFAKASADKLADKSAGEDGEAGGQWKIVNFPLNLRPAKNRDAPGPVGRRTFCLAETGATHYTGRVIGVLRFVGILNAALWCGSAIFLIIGLPALFSPEMKRLLTVPYVGFPAEAVIARFFALQYWCGAIAVAHLLAEWLYCGRPARRWNLLLVAGLLAVSLTGGLWLQPKMKNWHYIKYFGKTAELQVQAGKSFALWHAASETVNLLVIGGLILHLWHVCRPPESPRFGSFNKIRG